MVPGASIGAAGSVDPEAEGAVGIDWDVLSAGVGAEGAEGYSCAVPGDFSSCSTSNASTPKTKAPTSRCNAF